MLAAQPGQTALLTDEKGREVLAQVELAGLGGDQLELVLVRPVGLGKTLRVGKIVSPQAAAPYAASRQGDRTITFADGSEPIAVYYVGVRDFPGQSALSRANFFHPLVTPAGVTVSDDAPPDHLHHRGLFMAFTEATWSGDGRQLKGNFWHGDAAAKIAPGKVLYARGGPVCATMAVSHDFTIRGQTVLTQDVIARAARVERDRSTPSTSSTASRRSTATSSSARTSIAACNSAGRGTSTGPSWCSATPTGSRIAT